MCAGLVAILSKNCVFALHNRHPTLVFFCWSINSLSFVVNTAPPLHEVLLSLTFNYPVTKFHPFPKPEVCHKISPLDFILSQLNPNFCRFSPRYPISLIFSSHLLLDLPHDYFPLWISWLRFCMHTSVFSYVLHVSPIYPPWFNCAVSDFFAKFPYRFRHLAALLAVGGGVLVAGNLPAQDSTDNTDTLACLERDWTHDPSVRETNTHVCETLGQ